MLEVYSGLWGAGSICKGAYYDVSLTVLPVKRFAPTGTCLCTDSTLISRSLLLCSPIPQVVVLPSCSVSARTQCVTSGGTDCEWCALHGEACDDGCDGATLRLDIEERVERTVSTLQVRFELWNEIF